MPHTLVLCGGNGDMPLVWLFGLTDIIWLLLAAVLIVLLATRWYGGGSRSDVLERAVLYGSLGSPGDFVGTLAVEEQHLDRYLRLSNRTERTQQLQVQYRWLTDMASNPDFEEVAFDRESGTVELLKKQGQIDLPFSVFSAIQIREVHGWGDSLWQIELARHQGEAIVVAASEHGPSRERLFGRTAPLAKAVSEIMQLPVQVFVAANVWTRGWPPKQNGITKCLRGAKPD